MIPGPKTMNTPIEPADAARPLSRPVPVDAMSRFADIAPGRRRRTRSIGWKTGVVAALAATVAGAAWWAAPAQAPGPRVTATVARSELAITVTERGDLESSKTVDVRCEVEGEQIKIVQVLPEGTRVADGDVVLHFDTDKLSRSYAEQEVKWRSADAKARAAKEDLEVQRNKAASEVAKARLALLLADIDLDKYLNGDYQQERRTIQGDMLIAEEELKRARVRRDDSERLQRKGYVSASEVDADGLAVIKSQNTLDVAREKLRMLEDFTRKRQEAELKANAEEARRELDRTTRSQQSSIAKAQGDYEVAEVTASLEKAQLDKLHLQLDRCVVRAPQDGIVVYAKDRPWDRASRIEAGGVVHFQQVLFSLPDLGRMQVKVKVHESAIKKIAPDQHVEVRVDAYSDRVLDGVVDSVATLADSQGWFDQRGVKEYVTIVKIEELPDDAGLKPGMTAEIRVLIDRLTDVLVVPVEAVAEDAGEHSSFVVAPGGVERRPVVVGESNERFVEIREGLREGEQVALDARARLEALGERAKANGLAARSEPVRPAVGASHAGW